MEDNPVGVTLTCLSGSLMEDNSFGVTLTWFN